MKNVKNLKMYKKVLIVVDMVNGFVREGALADKHIEGTISIDEVEKIGKKFYCFVNKPHCFSAICGAY